MPGEPLDSVSGVRPSGKVTTEGTPGINRSRHGAGDLFVGVLRQLAVYPSDPGELLNRSAAVTTSVPIKNVARVRHIVSLGAGADAATPTPAISDPTV
jgi:hypothetical protein